MMHSHVILWRRLEHFLVIQLLKLQRLALGNRVMEVLELKRLGIGTIVLEMFLLQAGLAMDQN